MECDMEIEDESPEASGMEEATPPREPPAISLAPPIPVPPVVADREGQKVNQALPLITREGEPKAEEDDEPLPPGVEDDEPLPPGIEVASGLREIPPSAGNVAGEAALVSQEPGRSTEQPGEWSFQNLYQYKKKCKI